ncbi:ImmA/IrrE family metallo-endopeptidase [Companilactobacillus allii]|uniref:IrrE N-terminal-like domain-containing protein n=1 Tax=Companilactobacillus allii TaxID=1847728 RepID=A0A1P8Q5P6_9LACO|nr:ImmA/IrrE family metallo-endopeptidase [Companilactobacillus allii]APX73143.1 hypothetical protein BTM29_11525 [Companilactobacillus allii]USQ67947.1 ImmA/IrrE family metallo-endopeptidase [Companilactobacillus allii]
MINEITSSLMNLAFDNHISVIMEDKFSPYTPAAVDTKTKIIVINNNWHIQNQIPFQLAHEIGHVLNGDGFKACLYFSPAKNGIEGHANKTAIHLLVPLYFENIEYTYANAVRFMEAFNIPLYLENTVITEIKTYYS